MSEKNTGKKVTVVFAAAAILIGFLVFLSVLEKHLTLSLQSANTTE